MSDGGIQSLRRGVQLLECLARRGGTARLQELTAETGLPKSTVHRLLSTLNGCNLVEQDARDGSYRLGLHLFELGSAVHKGMNMVAQARPYLQRLSAATGESASLSLLNQGEALILEFIESTSAVHVVSRVGLSLPVHCTVQGKVMLAYLPGAEVRRILRQRGMKIYTDYTIDSYERLAPELEQIRAQGFATEHGEFRMGLSSVAAPVRDAAGTVCYAVAVVSMLEGDGSPPFERAKRNTIQIADALSRSLGYQG